MKYRLACHFKDRNHQIIKNERLFLEWFKHVNEDNDYSDEKYSILFKKDNFDWFLEMNYFFYRLKKFFLRKLKLN